MPITSRLSAMPALAAAFCLLATPVAAAELPRPVAVKAFDAAGDNAERSRRRWRGDGIDVGDVIAGVVLIGAISAIAGAARDAGSRDRYEDRYPTSYPYPGRDRAGYDLPGDSGSIGAGGIDRAVDRCVAEIEGNAERIGAVDAATRTANGWHISGTLDSGSYFSCTVDQDGRISNVDLGNRGYGTAPAEPVADGQWDDDAYAAAREDEGYPDYDDASYDSGDTSGY
jgi:hypothetical protein